MAKLSIRMLKAMLATLRFDLRGTSFDDNPEAWKDVESLKCKLYSLHPATRPYPLYFHGKPTQHGRPSTGHAGRRECPEHGRLQTPAQHSTRAPRGRKPVPRLG